MNDDIIFLEKEINNDIEKIKKSFPAKGRIAVLEFTRAVDNAFVYFSYIIKEENKEYQQARNTFYFVSTGFYEAIKTFLDESINNLGFPFFPSDDDSIRWANSCLIRTGHIGYLKRFLELNKQGLFDLKREGDEFYFKNKTSNPGREQLGVQDFRWWQENKEFALENEKLIHLKSLVGKQLFELTEVYYNFFIRYGCTPELDSFYEISAKINANILIGYDSFHNDAIFGGIKFEEIKSVLEALVGYALKHRDHCFTLLEKTSYKLNPWNLYTLPEEIDELSYAISEHKGLSLSKTKQVLELITITPENISRLGAIPGAAPPPLIKIGQDHVLRSMAGCLSNPFSFLLSSLKNSYEKDFFKAVNDREINFKKEFYSLFNSNNIHKGNSNISLKNNNKIVTNIDAALYDERNNFMLVVQLKWLDDFATSMRMRLSMSKNFYNSSKKWIDVVDGWIQENGVKQLIKKINPNLVLTNEVPKVGLLILGRNFSHFSDMKEDEKAAWCSWYRLLRVLKEHEHFRFNLFQLFDHLKNHSLEQVKLPEMENENLHIGRYKVTIAI